MAVVGVWALDVSGGTIGTSYPYTLHKNLSPAANVWATCMLQYIGETDDQTSAETWVSQYQLAGDTKPRPVHYSSVFANPCIFVEWTLFVNDCFARANCVLFYFR